MKLAQGLKFNFLSLVFSVLVLFVFVPSVSAANVALNKPITSSSPVAGGNPLGLITDGLMDYGYVVLPSGPQWVQLDFQGNFEISSFLLRHYYAAGHTITYKNTVLQTSQDGSNWKNVFNNDRNNVLGLGAGNDDEYVETEAGKTISFTPHVARYVRAWSNGSTNNFDNHYQELQVEGVAVISPTPPIAVSASPSNVALNKPLTSSSPVVGGNPLDLITDGLMDYGYVVMPDGPQWVQIDLQNNYQISSFILRHYYAPGHVITYHKVAIQISTDGLIWKTIFNNDNSNGLGLGAGSDSEYVETAEGKTISLTSPEVVRYVRAWSNGNTNGPANHYQELGVYGAQSVVATSVPTPTPTPTPTPVALPTAPTSCGFITIGGNNYERIPIKFYATYVNGRIEVIYAPGLNTPYGHWEISQQEYIERAKQLYYEAGTSIYDKVLATDPKVLQPTPCSDYAWKDGVPWLISSIQQSYDLANDPTLCIIGGTPSAPLYMPCVSPGYQQYLEQQLNNSAPVLPNLVPISLSTDDWNKAIQILRDNQNSIPNLPLPAPNPTKISEDGQNGYRATLSDNYLNGLLNISYVNLGKGKFSLTIQNNIPFWVAFKVKNALATDISIKPKNSTLDKFGLIPPKGIVSYDIDFGSGRGQLEIAGTLDEQAMIMNFGAKTLLKLISPLGDMANITSESTLILLSVPGFKDAASNLAKAYQSFKDRQVSEAIHSVKDFMFDLSGLLNTSDNRALLATKLVELGKIQESQIPDVLSKLQNVGKGFKIWDLFFNVLVDEAKFLGIAIAGQDRASFSFSAVPIN